MAPEGPTFAEAMTIVSGREDAWRAIWGVYFGFGAALVTLSASITIRAKWRLAFFAAATTLFLGFAVGNFKSLENIAVQRSKAVDYALSLTQDPRLHSIAALSAPGSEVWFRVYYWGLGALAVGLMAVILWLRDGSRKS